MLPRSWPPLRLPYLIWWALFAGCGLATNLFTYELFDDEAIAGFFVVALLLFFVYTGPDDLSVYPPPSESPYRLPWKPGIRRLCCQGNRAIVSHRNRETYAYDFAMPIGTEVCAARGGVVAVVVQSFDGNGVGWWNNEIYIRHDDKTTGRYLHLRKHGSRVRVGQRVAQGDVICESGNVGHSLGPHLHFEVVNNSQTIPITFADVPGDGIPRFLRCYTSGASVASEPAVDVGSPAAVRRGR